MSTQWTVIHNPKSCSGKGAKHWPEIEAILKREGIVYEVVRTEYAGHAIPLTEELVRNGARNLVAVGGDGTVNEVVNGIFRQEVVPSSEILLTQIPIGTGNDWRRTVGIPKDYAGCVRVLKGWREVRQDVGVVEFREQSAEISVRYFVNVAGMGFEAAVGLKANADKAAGKGGGVLGYIPALVGTLLSYACTEAGFEVDGKVLSRRAFYSMAIGICNYNGGGMKQCPDAIIDDGLLDLTLINCLSKAAVVVNVPRLFNGKFVRSKHVEQHRGAVIAVDCGPETLLEVDGENIGRGAARFSVLPRALRVAAAPIA
jgi:diacylglycerol kinase (ATP)